MLMPKRVKYRRVQRGRMTGKALRGNKVTYGEFGLQAQEPAWITSNQIEAAQELADELRALYPKTRPIQMDPLSLSVACHIGEGALAVACSKCLPVNA